MYDAENCPSAEFPRDLTSPVLSPACTVVPSNARTLVDPQPPQRRTLRAQECLTWMAVSGIVYFVQFAKERAMTRLNATDARSDFSTTLNKVAFTKERVLLERHGKPLAALVPVEDLELLQELEDRIDLAAARKALKEPGRIPWEKVKKDLGL